MWPAARREGGRAALVFEPLFSGWKGNDGRAQPFPGQPTHPCFLTPALPGMRVSFRPRFSLASASAVAFPWLCVGALDLLPLSLCPRCHPSLIAPKRLNTERLSNTMRRQ